MRVLISLTAPFVELFAAFLQIRGQFETFRQQARHTHQNTDIGNIAIDAFGNTRILHFDSEITSIR